MHVHARMYTGIYTQVHTKMHTRSHIFTLLNSHSLSLIVTNMLIQAHSHMLMHILNAHTQLHVYTD